MVVKVSKMRIILFRSALGRISNIKINNTPTNNVIPEHILAFEIYIRIQNPQHMA